MVKKVSKKNAVQAQVSATPVQAPEIVAAAKLTRRNTTPSNAVLVVTTKGAKIPRAAHNKAAWDAVTSAAPASAAVLAALPVFAGEHAAKLVSGPAFVSYMQRRGYLAIQS